MKNKFNCILIILGLFYSCGKEEFSANKASRKVSIDPLESATNKNCAQSTLIRPKVDILMLWDNSTSFNLVTDQTRKSMGQLITSVSENFDYHILSVPLISNQANTLHEAQLVAKDTNGLNSSALSILKSKDVAANELGFTFSDSSAEPGVDRAIKIIENNRSNGIFRNNAYTLIVTISNEDDDSCEAPVSEGGTGYSNCSSTTWQTHMQNKITKLLCLRGNTNRNCSGSGVTSPLYSTMMRYINISPIAVCSTENYKLNYRYRLVAKELYEASYTNGWPTSSDHLKPEVAGAFDSYNLCPASFSHIFDGVNTAITGTLIRHIYNYWPVAGALDSIDPDTITVKKSNGTMLVNRTGETNPTDGFAFVGNLTNQNTRVLPTPGEPFSGQMIQLFGVTGNDLVVYPECLTVSYKARKSKYGYVYLKYGEPMVSTIEVHINGSPVPQNATNGWDYIGLQYTATLNPNLKIVDLPSGSSSGYFIRLNGTYQIETSVSGTNIQVFYTSKN